MAMIALMCCTMAVSAEPVTLDFDGPLPEGWDAAGAELVEGREGNGLLVSGDAAPHLPMPGFITGGLDITLHVRHERSMPDLRFEELVYLNQDTEDMKNRIMLRKRIGADRILFAMTNGQGKTKGEVFADNWYAMQSGPLDWAAGSWHELRITADPAQGTAALYVDGERVASADGTAFPEVAGTLCIGNWSGRSQALAVFDDITIASVGE
jgi:hypothetical protein